VYSQPYRNLNASGVLGQRYTVRLGGASYELTAREGQTEALISHLGLGEVQTQVTVDDTVLFTADLNPEAGRHFDLTITKELDGQPLLTVSPSYDLTAMFHLLPLKLDGLTTVPSFYEDETYRVLLSPGAGDTAPQLKPVPADDAGFPGGLRVVRGTLSLTTDLPGVSGITVAEGECLADRDVIDGGDHPLLGHFRTIPCP
jgi:hypothetical protein